MYEPAIPVHESVEVPEPVTPVGVRLHVNPGVGETVAVRLTTPLKPWKAFRVIIEVPAVPELTVTDAGLASMVKSRIV